MVALNTATDIPSGIASVEELAVWCAGVLKSVAPTVEALEGMNYTELAVQTGMFFVKEDNKHRQLIRFSIPMSPAVLEGSLRPWKYAQVISTAAIPANFKSN